MLAIPFFIAAGEIMNESGITDKIVSFSKKFGWPYQRRPCSCFYSFKYVFSGISGSATADASALGSMLIP